MIQQNKSQLNQFINDMEATIRKYAMESDILRRAKPLLEELLRSPNSMPQSMSEYLFWTGFTGWAGLIPIL